MYLLANVSFYNAAHQNPQCIWLTGPNIVMQSRTEDIYRERKTKNVTLSMWMKPNLSFPANFPADFMVDLMNKNGIISFLNS